MSPFRHLQNDPRCGAIDRSLANYRQLGHVESRRGWSKLWNLNRFGANMLPMKAFMFLVVGALWLVAAITLSRTGFGIFLPKGTVDPNVVRAMFRIAVPAISFGWAVPVAVGLWLLIAHRAAR